jgi:AcrR family transcriptional regulator
MATADAPPGRQAERTAQSTRALLDAAAELIVEGGFGSLTFARIGERAGYSRGLVTARFGSKDGLLEVLIDRTVDRWNDRRVAPRTRGKPGFEGMEVILDAIRDQAERDAKEMRVLYALMFEALGPEEGLRDRFATFHEGQRADFARVISRGVEDGSIRADVDAGAEAALIISGLRGIGYQWLLDPERFDPVPALRYLHDTTAARLRAA